VGDTATINKWGNSLGIRLPKSYCEKLRLFDGDEVPLTLEEDRIIIAAPLEGYTLRERMKAWDRKRQVFEETDWGKPVGKEIW